MSSKHHHIEVPRKCLWGVKNGVPIFTMGSHDASYLVFLITTAAGYARKKGAEMSPMQRTAYDNFRRNRTYRFSDRITDIEDHEVLRAYFQLFDSLFFFGSLGKGQCEFILIEKPSELEGRNGVCTRRTSRGAWIPWKARESVRIVLYTRGGGSNRTSYRSVRLQKYVGTLLHEMIHAFLSLWSCDRKPCALKHENEGINGHGYAWQSIVAALEMAAQDKRLLGLDVDLLRENALALELMKSGREIPRKELLGRWGMKLKNVVTELERNGARINSH